MHKHGVVHVSHSEKCVCHVEEGLVAAEEEMSAVGLEGGYQLQGAVVGLRECLETEVERGVLVLRKVAADD